MNVHRTQLKGFTLIELMIATTLGLILLGGLVSIVAMVNTTFSDTRVLIDLQNRCRNTQMLLQNDLEHISVKSEAPRSTQADDGYLSLGVSNLTFSDTNKTSRGGVNLVDMETVNSGRHDYAAFTIYNHETPFTFTDPNNSSRILQTPYAEVVWFIYKNDLYRVVVPFVNTPEVSRNYPGTGWPNVRMISLALLGAPSKRIMEIIDTCINNNKIQQFLVLPNVCHFSVEVFNPNNQRYEIISEISNYFYGNKGNPRHTSFPSFTAYYDTGSFILESNSSGSTTQDNVYVNPDIFGKTELATTTSFLPGMRIIVRAFDPDTGIIRQFRVGQNFRTR